MAVVQSPFQSIPGGLLELAERPLSRDAQDPHAPPTEPKILHGLPLAAQLPRGRLIEFVDGHGLAPVTSAVACLRYAQQQGETTAWIEPSCGSLFPPDLADSGIDLQALVIVRIPDTSGPYGLCKAADLLLRSDGFGMVVLDLLHSIPSRDNAWQGRLLSLAREHESWLIILSPARAEGSLGPLISLCIETRRSRIENGLFSLTSHIRKDKSAALGSLLPEQRRGPWGLL